jgi:fatty acid desaturase
MSLGRSPSNAPGIASLPHKKPLPAERAGYYDVAVQTLQSSFYLLLLVGSTAAQAFLWRAIAAGGDGVWLSAGLIANGGFLVFLYVLLGLVIHEAAHGHLHRQRLVNTLLGHISAVPLQISFSLYRHLHWSHHGATNEPEDLELLSENSHHLPGAPRARALLALALLGGVERAQSFKRLLREKNSRLSPQLRRSARMELATMQAIGIAGSALWIWKLGVLSWSLAYLLPMLAGSWYFTWIQLCEHYGCPAGSEPEATRDVIPRNRLTAFLYAVMFNVNYHGIHHAKPGIPGDRLAEAHEAWLGELEASGKQPPPAFASYREIARAILPRLWRDIRNLYSAEKLARAQASNIS